MSGTPSLSLEQLREGHVGRRADQSAEAADVAGEGNADHDGLREARHLLLAVVVLQRLHQRRDVGDHHQSGGGVGNPHGEEVRGEHHAEQNAARALEEGRDEQGDTNVEVPTLHCEGEQESREEHENRVVEVLLRHGGRAEHAEEREQHHREQGRDGQRNDLRHPAGGHQNENAEGSLHLRVVRNHRNEQNHDRQDHADDRANDARLTEHLLPARDLLISRLLHHGSALLDNRWKKSRIHLAVETGALALAPALAHPTRDGASTSQIHFHRGTLPLGKATLHREQSFPTRETQTRSLPSHCSF